MPRGRKKGLSTPVDVVASPSKTKRARVFGKRQKANSADLLLAPAPNPLDQVNLRSRGGINANAVRSYSELMAALAAQKVQITLANNIIAEGNILITYDVAINFNGFSIISPEAQAGARVLDIRSGEVTLTGRGKIFAMGKGGVAIRVFGAVSSNVQHYTTLTVDEQISLFAPEGYGILISPNLGVAYGLTVNLHGQIFARDGICLASGIHGHEQYVPMINIKNEAKIMADEVNGAAIEAAGFGKWKVGTARLQAAMGGRLSCGHLKFAGTQILAHGTNPVFGLLESSEKTLRLTVDGGNYVSEQGDIIAGSPASLKKITLKSGDFYTATKLMTPELEKLAATNEEVNVRQDVAEFLQNFVEVEEFTLSEEPAATVEPIVQPVSESETAVMAGSEASTQTVASSELADQSVISSEPILQPETLQPEAALVQTATTVNFAPEAVTLSSAELDEQAIMSELLTDEDLPASQETMQNSTLVVDLSPVANSIPPVESAADLSTSSVVMPIAEPMMAPLAEPTPFVQPAAQTFVAPVTPFSQQLQVDEREAARLALVDALQEMQKINPADYPIGFDELTDAMRQASSVLENPRAELADFLEAAGQLLQAFDGLAQQDDSDLSDAELDELFYHGAVLEEMVSKKPKTSKRHKTAKTTKNLSATKSAAAAATKTLTGTTVAQTPPQSASLESAPPQIELTEMLESLDPEPVPVEEATTNPTSTPVDTMLTATADRLAFQMEYNAQVTETLPLNLENLDAVLHRVAELDFNRYTNASQADLLQALSNAQDTLNSVNPAQTEIDDLVQLLTQGLESLRPIRSAHIVPSFKKAAIPTKTPAPNVKKLAPATMIDELAPSVTWSVGVTMIDEMTPFVTDADTLEKMIRSTRPVLRALAETAASPLKKLAKSLSAGVHAGLVTYRETLHAGKIEY